MIFVLLGALVVALAVIVAGAVREMRGRAPHPLERRKVFVQLKSGSLFHGVLWADAGEWLVLRNAETLDDSGNPRPVDGEVVVYRAEVDFLQFP